jgi:hypothetical protein
VHTSNIFPMVVHYTSTSIYLDLGRGLWRKPHSTPSPLVMELPRVQSLTLVNLRSLVGLTSQTHLWITRTVSVVRFVWIAVWKLFSTHILIPKNLQSSILTWRIMFLYLNFFWWVVNLVIVSAILECMH